MCKTGIDVDDRLLDPMRQVLGAAPTRKSTDTAPGNIIRTEERRREIEALAVMDRLDLADESVMASAWRS